VLAFSQVVFVIVSVWYSVTGGDDGLNGIPIPGVLFSHANCYYFVSIIVAVCLRILYIIRQSPFGRALHAIRDNRARAGFIGINTRLYIYIAYVISGVFTGIAGILLVVLMHGAFPQYAGAVRSADLLFVCILGGMYDFSGPIVGALLYIVIQFLVYRYTEYWPLVLGTAVVSIAIFFRGGVVGFIAEKKRELERRKEQRNAAGS
jgi:branched-chain amino acid transport system permease protein